MKSATNDNLFADLPMKIGERYDRDDTMPSRIGRQRGRRRILPIFRRDVTPD
jgi:hypothetical protein